MSDNQDLKSKILLMRQKNFGDVVNESNEKNDNEKTENNEIKKDEVLTESNENEFEAKKNNLENKILVDTNSELSEFKENLNKMLDELDIPRGLNEIGVPEDSFKRIAKKSMLDQAYGQNPKKATLEEVEQLTLKSIKKAR